jgi:diguanylate cyclase (GGDEF)-like protein
MMLLIGGITYYVVDDAQHQIVEFQAVNVAEIVARQAAASRSVYAAEVAAKLVRDGTGPHAESQFNRGFVPLPAQFLKLVGREASTKSDDLYRYMPVSKWNLEPTQGLRSGFQRWAWSQLEAQDRSDPTGPIAWQPVWRFETVDDVKTLLYLRADPAAAESCVSCHNALERSDEIVQRRKASGVPVGKEWKLNQLMGAIQVEIPLDKVGVIVASQTRQTLVWIMAVLAVGLLFATWFVVSDFSRARRIMRLSWLVAHDPVTGFYNSRAIGLMLERLVADAKQNGRQHALCHVHLIGLEAAADMRESEQLLKMVAERMRRWVRPKVTIVRLHAMHFALLMPNVSPEEARDAADALLRSIKMLRPTGPNIRVREIGVNIGIVMIDERTESADSVLKAAERSCQTAETRGTNRLCMA